MYSPISSRTRSRLGLVASKQLTTQQEQAHTATPWERTKLGFFDLPPEIRIRIYELAIPDLCAVAEIVDEEIPDEDWDNYPPKKYCTVPRKLRLNSCVQDHDKLWVDGRRVHHCSNRHCQCRTGTAPLFHLKQVLVNRQFYSEFGAAVRAAPIDFRFYNGFDFYKTCKHPLRSHSTPVQLPTKYLARVRDVTLEIGRDEGFDGFCQLVLPRLLNLTKLNIVASVGVNQGNEKLYLMPTEPFAPRYLCIEKVNFAELTDFPTCLRTDRHLPDLLEAGRKFWHAFLAEGGFVDQPRVDVRLTLRVGEFHYEARESGAFLGLKLSKAHFAKIESNGLNDDGTIAVTECLRKAQEHVNEYWRLYCSRQVGWGYANLAVRLGSRELMRNYLG
ncbi:uncharacterized protein AB675_1542 [Cyphellophora attinorum]|uniref:Uncharacterized protein n=1 Tax=Cyphellophora attinorum TaxID=1664694 RepID=A0A0N1H0C6_9EURO|nr:uncharacterized protein AB675_1542 [Phialophora attinorum]KPI37264.1 hypothetical protein AB675_1542 [Phialophora attinorum]